MKNIAIIPARGGSKRIPRKNIKDFLGKPIIAYSIEAAIQSNLFEEIMVSTDDEEIAEVAERFGAKVPFMRSTETANDFASTNDVLKEVIATYEKQNIAFENMCCIYATAPLIQSNKIIEAYHRLVSSEFSMVYPVVPFSYPIWRCLDICSGVHFGSPWRQISLPASVSASTRPSALIVTDPPNPTDCAFS